MAMFEFKCFYYGKAVTDGNEDCNNAMPLDNLLNNIQKVIWGLL